MPLFSYFAVYVLFWVMSAFLVMPFGIRSHDDEQAELVPGQVSSAPVNFRPRQIMLRATVLSLALCGLFFANLHYGWITADSIAALVPVPASLLSATIYR